MWERVNENPHSGAFMPRCRAWLLSLLRPSRSGLLFLAARAGPSFSFYSHAADRPKGGRHWTFTEENNAQGVIVPERVLEAIEASGAEEVVLVFEFFFSAHALSDESALDDMKKSVDYWREALVRFYGK